uniref:S-locus glycoprotein domain-containing protein n=1 Tax=Oryza brachyantha TaxID=4533 RepID=J3LX33_ORYBR
MATLLLLLLTALLSLHAPAGSSATDTISAGQRLGRSDKLITRNGSGEWNGQYFSSVAEMSSRGFFNSTFINNDKEKYFTYTLDDATVVIHRFLDATGQTTMRIWSESSMDWVMVYGQPKTQCDVYATCGPFAICNDNELPYCNCMRGFTVRSPKDWELGDRTGGCLRDTPLDCITNRSTSSTDMFYSMPCVKERSNLGPRLWNGKSFGERLY